MLLGLLENSLNSAEINVAKYDTNKNLKLDKDEIHKLMEDNNIC